MRSYFDALNNNKETLYIISLVGVGARDVSLARPLRKRKVNVDGFVVCLDTIKRKKFHWHICQRCILSFQFFLAYCICESVTITTQQFMAFTFVDQMKQKQKMKKKKMRSCVWRVATRNVQHSTNNLHDENGSKKTSNAKWGTARRFNKYECVHCNVYIVAEPVLLNVICGVRYLQQIPNYYSLFALPACSRFVLFSVAAAAESI